MEPNETNPFGELGILISLKNSDDFLIVRETLSRLGIASKTEKVLTQSCHILHKRGKYAIMHFKELFKLDGKPTDISPNDIERRNSIALMLENWDLVKILADKAPILENQAEVGQIKILPSKEKSEWRLVSKYQIGSKSRPTS